MWRVCQIETTVPSFRLERGQARVLLGFAQVTPVLLLKMQPRARVNYLLYNVDQTRSLGFAEFTALVRYEFRD